MRFVRLVALAADREIKRDPGLLGVRLSPVSLRPDSARDLIGEATRVLGKRLFIAISVPGASYEFQGQVCVAPDERAAERATAWRNAVRVGDGEHILYVSVEPHGKAGGLQDCLFPLDERTLRSTLIDWANEESSGIPEGLPAALVDAGITERVSAAALCAYAAAVLRDTKKLGPWEAAGRNLPALGFAADTRLRAADAVQRLRINADLVSKAAAAERRHQSLAGRSEVVADLVQALHGTGEDVTKRLAGVDLGALTTNALDRVRRPQNKSKGAGPSAGNRQPKVSKSKKGERRTRSRAANTPQVLLDRALELPAEDREAALLKSAGAQLAKGGESPARSEGAGGTARGGSEVWNVALQRREFGDSGQIPAGLAEIVCELAQRGGWQVLWEPQRDARSCLIKLPSTLTASVETFDVPAPIVPLFDRWRAARVALLDLLMRDGRTGGLLAFAAGPLAVLGDSAIRDAVRGFISASRDLFEGTVTTSGSELPRSVISLDTALLRSKVGDIVVVLGPLHPLWLSQCLSRFEAMLNEPTLEKEGRRLLVRSLTEAPAAPQSWPIGGPAKELLLARPESGFIVYESQPTCADDATLEFIGERITARYLDLLPHSRLGLRIAVDGEGASSFVEGVARTAANTPDLMRVEILYSGSSLNLDGRYGSDQIAAGRLSLNPVPAASPGAHATHGPHLSVRLVPPPRRPEDEELGVPEVQVAGAGSGLLPTEFQVTRSGLRARIPLDGHAVLQAIEAVHALARGRLPQKSFVGDANVTALTVLFPPVLERGTWQVAIGHRLGRRAREGQFLLAHERVTDVVQVVAVSDNINPISRALENGFRRLGVNDLRPSILRVLATRLAEASAAGLLSLSGSDDHLIAAGLLGLYLRADVGRQRPSVLAPVEGASALTLLGRSLNAAADGVTTVAIASDRNALKVVVGFATLSASDESIVQRGQLEGALAERLSRLLAIIKLTSECRTLGGLAAREALNWLLWPAIAASEVGPGELTRLVEGIGGGTELAVEVVCLAPPSNALGRRGDVRLGKIPVRTVPLDVPLVERLVLST